MTASQVSSVQGLWSSQSGGVPATQVLFTHVSSPLQMSPSSQSPSLTQQLGIGALTQPDAGSHTSLVQTKLSSQSSGSPPWQPACGSQVSWPSQGFPLSHTSGVPLWQVLVLVLQVSAPLQTLPSSQPASVVQQSAIGAFTQPPVLLLAVGSQLSAVHTIPSSQVGGVPSTHVPSCGLQVSRPLQKWPLSQVTAAGCAHAPCPSPWAAVQPLPSSSQVATACLPPGM